MAGESACHALFRTKAGLGVSFEAILSSGPISRQPWFQILCERGEILVDGDFSGGYGVQVFDELHPELGDVVDGTEGWDGSYNRQMAAFIDTIREQSGSDVRGCDDSWRQALADLTVIHTMLASGTTGCWESITCE